MILVVFLDTLIASTHVIYHLSFITAVKLTLQSTKQYMEKDEIIVIHPARIKHSALVILSQSKDTFAASAKKNLFNSNTFTPNLQ